MHTIFARMVEHLARLAQHPGARDHARQQAKLLEACESGLWHGLSDAVRQRIGQAPATASAPQNPKKPP